MAASATFLDPYLVIIRDDSSVLLLQADESGDLDEVLLPNEVNSSRWRSGCLYRDNSRSFSIANSSSQDPSEDEVLLFLLSLEYKLSVGRREKNIQSIGSDLQHRSSNFLA